MIAALLRREREGYQAAEYEDRDNRRSRSLPPARRLGWRRTEVPFLADLGWTDGHDVRMEAAGAQIGDACAVPSNWNGFFNPLDNGSRAMKRFDRIWLMLP